MEQPLTLHSILDEYRWVKYDVSAIKQFLEQDSSSINEVRDGIQPLHKVLRKDYCSKEVVKLLLDYGAEVNPTHSCSISHLQTALSYNVMFYYNLDVIRLLLERGADVNRIHNNFCSLLSYALHRRNCSKEDVQLLLDFAAAPRSWCTHHHSLLQCYVHSRNVYVRASVVELLIRESIDLGNRHPFGRSTLCHALHARNCNAFIVKLLLTAGTHISECDNHFSPLHCYVSARGDFLEDIVKLLVDQSTDFNHVYDAGNTLLHLALRDCRYDMAAVKVLLEKNVDVTLKNENGYSPLIFAITNHHFYYIPEAVQLLIKKGARLDEVDSRGCIPLHHVVTNNLTLVRMLVVNGSPLNVRNNMGLTPIDLAFQSRNYSVFKLLLIAGARLDVCVWIELLTRNIGESESRYKDKSKYLKLLLRYAILEDRYYNFKDFLKQVHCMHLEEESVEIWESFVEECIAEVQQMSISYVSQYVTLLEFATYYPYDKLLSLDAREYDFNRLLRILASNAFPLYFEIISTKVKSSYMANKLQELLKHVLMGSCDSTCVDAKMVILNSHCAVHIASFLPKKDFLNFIIALKFPSIVDN